MYVAYAHGRVLEQPDGESAVLLVVDAQVADREVGGDEEGALPLREILLAPVQHVLRELAGNGRSSFENFKSTVCHRVKELGDINFIIDTLESQDIRTYYNRKWYPESLYLLAMLDYLSRENDVPICDDYDDLRRCRLEKPVYPASIRALSAAAQDDAAIKEAAKSAIPEFMRFNIVENEVRNVI